MEKILTDIENALECNQNSGADFLAADKWLLVSALQKAIRRNDVETAISAAISLLHQDAQYFWFRLPVIAVEDVGASAPEIISKVLIASASPTWRQATGDSAVGLYLVKLLCGSVKTRLADSIFIQIEKSRLYYDNRYKFASLKDSHLISYVVNENNPLPERCLALWYLAGTKKYPSDHLFPRMGSMANTIKALKLLNIPATLKEACVQSLYRSRWPLSIFIPLIWQEIQKQPCSINYDEIPASVKVHGLPHYAVDQFTRIGKACLRELKLITPALQQYSAEQLGLGLFYIDGGRIERAISSLALDAISKAGEYADIEATGLSLPEYMKMKRCLVENLGKLALIRQEFLMKLLNNKQYAVLNP